MPDMTPDPTLERVAREYRQTLDVVIQWLRDMGHHDELEEKAAALLARLASHNPPILFTFPEEYE